ncbi:hypothetical protein chiPu_0030751, partial [Chiloscyllium punctatum]|nr:hypothetical protein [Chiloscyllium punctatum]
RNQRSIARQRPLGTEAPRGRDGAFGHPCVLRSRRQPDGIGELIGPPRRDDPAEPVLADGQGRLGLGFGDQDDRPAGREQIIEPARDRYTGDVLAIGNEPGVRAGEQRIQLAVRDAVDQRDVGQLRCSLHVLQPRESHAPPREQEMDIALLAQQPRGLEDDIRVVGETQIAGQANDEAGGNGLAKRIVGADGTIARGERGPIRDEADLGRRHSAIAQQQLLGVAADDDDRVQGTEHQ